MKKTFRLFSASLVLALCLGMTACQSSQHKTSTKSSTKTQMTSKSSQKKSSSQSSKGQEKNSSSSSSASSSSQADKKQGDYSSIAGTWTDASGRVIVISPQGRISVLGTRGTMTIGRDGKGEALMTVTYDDGSSFGILIYGAGQAIPERHFQSGQADPSDTSKDRLVTAYSDILDQGGSEQFKNQVLYKSSNDYSSLSQ